STYSITAMQANKKVYPLQHNGMLSWGTHAYPGAYGGERAVCEAPGVEPGFALPTEAGGYLGCGQEGCRIDAVEACRDVNCPRLWRPKPARVEEGFDGLPAGTSWAKARGRRRQLGRPCGFQGLAHARLPRP